MNAPVLPVLLDCLSIGLLLLLFIQDWKNRSVQLILFPLLLLVLVCRGAYTQSITSILTYWTYNVSFLLFHLLLVTIYFSLKKRKLVWLLSGMVGWGDVLFWLVVCTCFSFIHFILYFISSLLVSLVSQIVFICTIKEEHRKMVPLAGIQAAFLAFLLTLRLFSPSFNFYQEDWLINYIT